MSYRNFINRQPSLSFARYALWVSCLLGSVWGCGSDSADGGDPPASGGTVGVGGSVASGGSFAIGGTLGAGGAASAGGSMGTGGIMSSGGDSASGGDASAGGVFGVGGDSPTGGASGNGGDSATGGDASTGGDSGTGGDAGTGGDNGMEECTSTDAADNFSFFVTSMYHIKELSQSNDGFGGDLRYNGATTGLEGADAICQEMARIVCHGDKTWKAFLSTSEVDAIDRIGTGPWYDHGGTLVAEDLSGLADNVRPAGGCCDNGTLDEMGILHDGISNGDDHDTLTGSTKDGRFDSENSSCDDWTSTSASGRPRVGHSWPRSSNSGLEWIQEHNAGGCGAGINTSNENGAGGAVVGSGGGYGGFYCFALAQ